MGSQESALADADKNRTPRFCGRVSIVEVAQLVKVNLKLIGLPFRMRHRLSDRRPSIAFDRVTEIGTNNSLRKHVIVSKFRFDRTSLRSSNP